MSSSKLVSDIDKKPRSVMAGKLWSFHGLLAKYAPHFRPRYHNWYYRRFVPHVGVVVRAVPVLSALASFLVLSGLPTGGAGDDQVREMYQLSLEDLRSIWISLGFERDVPCAIDIGRLHIGLLHLTFGLATTMCLSLSILASYRLLSSLFMDRTSEIYYGKGKPQSASGLSTPGRGLPQREYLIQRNIRDCFGWVLAMMPPAGLAIGVVSMFLALGERQAPSSDSVQSLYSHCSQTGASLHSWPQYHDVWNVAFWAVVGVVIAIVIALPIAWSVHRVRRHGKGKLHRSGRNCGTSLLVLSGIVFVLAPMARGIFCGSQQTGASLGAGPNSDYLGAAVTWAAVAIAVAIASLVVLPMAWDIFKVHLRLGGDDGRSSGGRGETPVRGENVLLLLGILITLFVVVVAMFSGSEAFVGVFQKLGPLASTNILLIALVSTLTLIALFANSLGLPLLLLLIAVSFLSAAFGYRPRVADTALVFVCLLSLVKWIQPFEFDMRSWWPRRIRWVKLAGATLPGLALALALCWQASVDSDSSASPSGADLIRPASTGPLTAFKSWLDQRPDFSEAAGDSRFPVFIFTAPGGGVYAMSAVSIFLGRLQAHCPDFARHVFAISAVSGGAIGATLFNASLPRDTLARTIAACDKAVLNDPASARRIDPTELRVIESISVDLISPLIAAIIPDLIDKVIQLDRLKSLLAHMVNGPAAWLGFDPPLTLPDTVNRATVLESSVASTIEDADKRGVRGIEKDHSPAWNKADIAPALLLNTTWVEDGRRMVFSPFWMEEPVSSVEAATCNGSNPPERVGDHSLQALPGYEAWLTGGEATELQAAVSSARFPLVAPAWKRKLAYRRCAGGQLETGTFSASLVDGGYADNSGALTAYELFEFLDSHVRRCASYADRERQLRADQHHLDGEASIATDEAQFARIAQDYQRIEQELAALSPMSSACLTPAGKNIRHADLRLVLISEDIAPNDYERSTANPLIDTAAPLLTLNSVRSRIGEQSVARACHLVRKQAEASAGLVAQTSGAAVTSREQACPTSTEASIEDANWKVAHVRFDRSLTPLPLGWTLSATTRGKIALAMGNPGACRGGDASAASPGEGDANANRLRHNNSCVMASIISAIARSRPSSPATSGGAESSGSGR